MLNIPHDLSLVADDVLVSLQNNLRNIKRELLREIDNIDTESIGIKEELRKRKEKRLAALKFPGAFTKG